MDNIGKIGILLVVLITLGNFFWNSNLAKIENKESREETWVDDQGHLHVLGLTLNVTTLREAEIALKSRTDPALFLYNHHDTEYHLVLEAYFPSIADHSKVILGLAVSDEKIMELESRATPPRMNNNGVGRMNLNNSDLIPIQQYRVEWIRLIPSNELEAAMIKARFGDAEQVIQVSTQLLIMLYPEIGLQVILREDGKDELNFFHPAIYSEGIRDVLIHAKIEAVL